MARPKKIQHFKLRQHRNPSGTESWQVTGTKRDGTRVRKNFKDKADALGHVADMELEMEGVASTGRTARTHLSPEQLSDAEAALRQLGGSSLSQAVSHYLNLRSRVQAKRANLDQAVSFFESRYRPETQEITLLNAIEEFKSSRNNVTEATKANYETGLALLLMPDPNALVHSFTVGDVERILKKYSNTRTQRSFRSIFSVFFSWAVRHHYCLENPCDRLDKLPREMSKIAALSLDEVKRLLIAAADYQQGAAAAAVAIGLFAGLRPSEINDLQSEEILTDRIRVSGGKLRRQLNRSVPIPPVLAAWLSAYPFTGPPAGWNSKLKTLKKATKAKKWVMDIIRHTSITFQAERDKNEALTAFNCGTSVAMMNRHYRHTIDDEQVIAEFWSLTPEKLRANAPDIELPSKQRITWPDKRALKKLVWSKPMVHAAREVRVSDVALRKHCVKEGIELPPRGHWARLAAHAPPARKRAQRA